MKAHCLTAVIIIMLSSAAAHAQFPTLPPVPRTGNLVDDPGSTHFTFIAAGDNRPSNGAIKQPKTLAHILEDTKRFNPTFIIWSGDTIGGFRTPKKMDRSHLTAQYEEFFKTASKAGVPVFNSPGNHEMDRVDKLDNPQKETIETPDKDMQKLYLETYGYPADASGAYGAFNFGNSRFIAVDTEEVPTQLTVRSPGKTVAKKLKLDPGFVTPKQIELLKADLEANKDKKHIFVFMHHPINPAKSGSRLNKDNADELEKIFAKHHNVTYVIAAHEHVYYYHGGKKLNPPPRKSPSKHGPGYLVSGGAGAPLDSCPKNLSKNCSASFHYLVFHVKGDEVHVKFVKVPAPPKKAKTKPQSG